MTARPPWRQRLVSLAVICAAAIALCWPAFWNRYPLLNPDCIGYLRGGRPIILLLLGDRAAPANYFRSEIYSAGIYLLHWNITPWPLIAFSALITAWMLWMVVRSLSLPQPRITFLALVSVLCIVSTAPWFVSLLMPDSFGAVLYLCLYLLIFARESLRRWEPVAITLLACWCVTTHPTHLMLAVGLCLLLGLLWSIRWLPLRGRGRHLLLAAAAVLVAIVSQMAVHERIYGSPSVMGQHQPYLLARIVADGPARTYLHDFCPSLHWVICNSVDRLPGDEETFLWAPDGVYQTSTPAQKQQLSAEEMPLIRATLRTHPRRQVVRSWHNFTQELTEFGPDDTTNGSQWMNTTLDVVLPGESATYLHSRQFHNALYRQFFRTMQKGVVALSAVGVLLLLPWVARNRRSAIHSRLLGLTVIVVFILLANAAVTGVLSAQDSRYEGRIAWLAPMLLFLSLSVWRTERKSLAPKTHPDRE